jgi:hypothetical protein
MNTGRARYCAVVENGWDSTSRAILRSRQGFLGDGPPADFFLRGAMSKFSVSKGADGVEYQGHCCFIYGSVEFFFGAVMEFVITKGACCKVYRVFHRINRTSQSF